MREAPEIIWASPSSQDGDWGSGWGEWEDFPLANAGETKYRRADAKMEAAEARIRELEAALPRAWEMGRDEGAQVARERWLFRSAQWQSISKQDYPWVAIDRKTLSTQAKEADLLCNAISTLTPPADLAERIIAAQSKIGGE